MFKIPVVFAALMIKSKDRECKTKKVLPTYVFIRLVG